MPVFPLPNQKHGTRFLRKTTKPKGSKMPILYNSVLKTISCDQNHPIRSVKTGNLRNDEVVSM